MKILCALLVIIVVALISLAAIGPDDLAKSHIKAMRDDGSITNVVNMLFDDGTVCQVRGHRWGNHMHVTLEYAPNLAGCRECVICKLHQSLYTTEWR